MREEYDFSQARANLYAQQLKQPLTISLDQEAVAFFEQQAKDAGISCELLLARYLEDCARRNIKFSLS